MPRRRVSASSGGVSSNDGDTAVGNAEERPAEEAPTTPAAETPPTPAGALAEETPLSGAADNAAVATAAATGVDEVLSQLVVDGQAFSGVANDGSEIVMGVPIEDHGMSRMVRRVIILATIGATFYILHFIVNLMRESYDDGQSQDATSLWAAMSSLLIELSIPACGYCGALYNNRQLTCCFCSCNLFIAIVSVMSFIRLNVRIGELDGQCELESNAQQRRSCEVWVGDGVEKYLMLTSTIVIVCIGCLAFWFGNNLYNRLAQDFSLQMPMVQPLVGEVISLSSSNGLGVAINIAAADSTEAAGAVTNDSGGAAVAAAEPAVGAEASAASGAAEEGSAAAPRVAAPAAPSPGAARPGRTQDREAGGGAGANEAALGAEADAVIDAAAARAVAAAVAVETAPEGPESPASATQGGGAGGTAGTAGPRPRSHWAATGGVGATGATPARAATPGVSTAEADTNGRALQASM